MSRVGARQRQEINQGVCVRTGLRPRPPRCERLHLPRPRCRAPPLNILRRADRKRRTHPPAPEMVLSGNLHSHGLPHAPASAIQASGVSRGIEGLEEPALDSAAVIARRGGPACTISASPGSEPDRSDYRRRPLAGLADRNGGVSSKRCRATLGEWLSRHRVFCAHDGSEPRRTDNSLLLRKENSL